MRLNVYPYPAINKNYPKANTVSFSSMSYLYYVKQETFVSQSITPRLQHCCKHLNRLSPNYFSKLIFVRFSHPLISYVRNSIHSANTLFLVLLKVGSQPALIAQTNQSCEHIHSPRTKTTVATRHRTNYLGKPPRQSLVRHHHQTAFSQIFEAPQNQI